MAGTDDSSSIHVLLLSYPAQGHINPLLQLGKRLAAHRGVRCTLAVSRFVLAQSEPSPGAVHVATYSDGCDSGGYNEAGNEQEFLARLESAGSASLDELLRAESAQGRAVHAVVYDSFLVWAPPVARLHGASCAAFFTQACAVNVAYSHAWAGMVELPLAAGKGEALPELPGLPAGLEPADFPTFLTEPDGGCRAYLDLLVQQCQGFEVADHILVNSFYELETKVSTNYTYARALLAGMPPDYGTREN